MDEKTIMINLAKIRDKKFRANYKNYGYDAKEVDEFLDLALEVNTALKNENNQLTDTLIKTKQQLSELNDKVKTLENEILRYNKKIQELEGLGYSVVEENNHES